MKLNLLCVQELIEILTRIYYDDETYDDADDLAFAENLSELAEFIGIDKSKFNVLRNKAMYDFGISSVDVDNSTNFKKNNFIM